MGTRVLFIGIDAADKDLILDWAAAGMLPTFRRLLDETAWGTTSNPPGLFVGALWPSFATGVSPARHGRYCFEQIRSGSYEVGRVRPFDIGAEPFWNALSRAGRRVAIIDVPKTCLMRGLNGMQVVDWGTHDPDFSLQTWPRALARTLRSQFGPDPVGFCDAYAHTPADIERLRDALQARTQRKAEMSAHFMGQGNWDLFLTVFSETHCAGHQFWHMHDPTHPQHDARAAARMGDPLRDVYVSIDQALGRLLEPVDPGTTVFILASHGMGPHYDATALLDTVLHRIEGTLPPQPAAPALPALLTWCWQHLPASARARLAPLRNQLRRRLDAVPKRLDGSRTYFVVPNNDAFGGIRLNLVGREPRGRVRPGEEADALCAALSQALHALVNTDTGEPAVRGVTRITDLYRGPRLDELPDLLVEWNRTAPLLRLDSPKTGRIVAPQMSHRTGDHVAPGLFFARGPSVRPGPLDQTVAVTDFASTVGALLGVEIPDIEGQPIAALRAAER